MYVLKIDFAFLSFTSFYLVKENIVFIFRTCETSHNNESNKHMWQWFKI